MTKTIQIRVDEQFKADVDSLFDSLGLDTSTAVRMFFKAALEQNGLPFAVQRRREQDDFDNLRPEYKQAIEDARLERNLIGPFKTAEEAFARWLED